MRVALVHDYLNVYGGAERVLEALCELYPDAPIYTSFCKSHSPAAEAFSDKRIIESFAARIPGFTGRLHSPLRFLIPLMWESFDLDDFDVVISSSAAYISKGVLTRPETLHISYIHTPPRALYGYDTGFSFRKFALVKGYASLVAKGLREFDYLSSQRVDVLVANSKEVARRIEKYYRRAAEVIHPPVEVRMLSASNNQEPSYFLAGGRLVGIKNFDVIVTACRESNLPLKIYGDGPELRRLQSMGGEGVEFVGRVDDEKLKELYAGAWAYVAMARDEDFGITVVEAQAQGVPVVCYRGGGYLETVVEGKTGEFVDELSSKALGKALKGFDPTRYKRSHLLTQAKAYSPERFKARMKQFVDESYAKHQERYA